MPSRRTFLTATAAGVGTALLAPPTASWASSGRKTLDPANTPTPYGAAFRRPPELLPYESGFDDGDPARPFARYSLTQRIGQASFLPGLTTTVAGYNGIFPGPTIRVNQGTRIEARIRNALPDAGLLHAAAFDTVTHLHGSASLPQYDGYANDFTAPGRFKTYKWPNWQAARTMWYHDHNHHLTAQNVYSGLAAAYIVSDSYERAQLPQGEYDVPIVLSDATFAADGSLAFNHNQLSGLWGDTILVNGVPWPTMNVKPRIYRFRFLVAAVSRSFRPTLSTKDPMYIVGTDAGMMLTPQAVSSWRHGVAERYEVLIDFRRYRVGQLIQLRNLSNKNNIDYANTGKIMQFRVIDDQGPASSSVIPLTLDPGPSPMAPYGGISTMSLTPAMATASRDMVVGRRKGKWTINDVTWQHVQDSGFSKLFANPQPFAIEKWTIRNESGGWFHPLHIHLVDCQVIARNTNGGKPFAWELGPKDVFYIGENESVTVLMQFDSMPERGGRYMIHCHNLVHEDHDMMVQFAVGDWRINDPVTADPPRVDTLGPDAFPPAYRPGYPIGT